MGTPWFMSPEVHRGRYDGKADLWSLCASFYFIFTKEAPYFNNKDLDNVEILLAKINCTNYVELTAADCDDAVLREIINDTLSKESAERPSLDYMMDAISKSFDYES